MAAIRGLGSGYDNPDDAFMAIKHKTANDWHVYHTYKDPEFAEANRQLLDEYGISIEATGSWADDLIPPDSEANFRAKQNQLITSYHITKQDWEHFNRIPLDYRRIPQNVVHFRYDQDEDTFKIEVRPEITTRDMDELYRSIQNMRYVYQIDGSRAKRKEPEYPDLIYAMFKARQKNMEYPEIYSHYKDRDLPYYKGKTPRLTLKELREYYLDHSPEN
jgi:hypothetical protein